MLSLIFSIPGPLGIQASISDLKKRLDWGEPALTIVDIRSRTEFNSRRIMGAVSIPADELVDQVSKNLELSRDIYIYGHSDEQALEAVHQLRDAGYTSVAALKGGLGAWKAMRGSVEGLLAVA